MSVQAAAGRLTVGGISVSWRERPRSEDAAAVRRIAESSGFFNAAEVAVAVELVQAGISQGQESGYYFLFADAGASVAEPVGYSCFGPIPCTEVSFDLYWIAVEDRHRGIGLGGALLAQSEAIMKRMGGKRVYVETSSRLLYQPTRLFYSRRGYRQEALIADFYAPGDGKVIYVKELK